MINILLILLAIFSGYSADWAADTPSFMDVSGVLTCVGASVAFLVRNLANEFYE